MERNAIVVQLGTSDKHNTNEWLHYNLKCVGFKNIEVGITQRHSHRDGEVNERESKLKEF